MALLYGTEYSVNGARKIQLGRENTPEICPRRSSTSAGSDA